MDLWQIESIIEVAKTMNITRAAENLCMSQSALSLQIIKLEEELGVKLFERTTRNMRLTPAGQNFVEKSLQISSLVKQTKRSMEEFVALERGHVVIGTLPIMGYLGIPSLIAAFKKKYPGITVTIHEAASDRLIELLESADIDAAVFTPPANIENLYPEVQTDLLFSDEVILIVSSEHQLAEKDAIDFNEVAYEDHILMKANYGMRETLIDTCEKAGFKPRIVYECEQVESIIGLVAAGLGVAFLNIRIPLSSKEPNIKILHTRPALMRTTVLAVRTRSRISPAIDAFRETALAWSKMRT